jgi:hypothetical protein
MERRTLLPMTWLRWVVVALAVFEAGFMTFDGSRALIVGDYITPKTGEYAGQLGPWAGLVNTIGIEPRSTPMKTFFFVYGAAWLLITVAFATGVKWAWWGMLTFALGSLWYLTLGTIASVAILALLLLPPIRNQYI